MSTPWKYIKLSQVMASVKSDLNLYDDAGLIDNDKVIKIVAECNEKLGQRIFKSRECKINVSNGIGDLPSDFWKLENIFATNIINSIELNPLNAIRARQVEFLPERPCDTSKIITYGKMGCVDSCNNCYWVEDRRSTPSTTAIQYEQVIPLTLSDKMGSKCLEYSPCNGIKGQYKVDLEDDQLSFSFNTGEVYLCYLGSLISEDGEIEIPFHPKLNAYYEYSIMEKILEDIFLNSDADVIKKLQYITEKKRSAYAIAWDYVQTKQVNEWNNIQKKLKNEYYEKWYRMFN